MTNRRTTWIVAVAMLATACGAETATTGGGVSPVTKVNERMFSNGAPGERTLEILKIYRSWLERPEFRDEVDYN